MYKKKMFIIQFQFLHVQESDRKPHEFSLCASYQTTPSIGKKCVEDNYTKTRPVSKDVTFTKDRLSYCIISFDLKVKNIF